MLITDTGSSEPADENKRRKEISVVTITFRDPDGFAKTASSIDCQSRRDLIQWIVVNGDPNDENVTNTAGELEYPPDILVQECDDGIYDAMNKGLNLANAKHVLFLNGGDCFLEKESVAALLNVAERATGRAVIAQTQKIAANGTRVTWPQFPFSPIRHLLGLQMHAHPSFLAPTDLLRALGGFKKEYGFAGDFDLVTRVLLSVDHIELEKAIALFDGGGVSSLGASEAPRLLARVRRDVLQPGPVLAILIVLHEWILRLRYRLAGLRSRARSG